MDKLPSFEIVTAYFKYMTETRCDDPKDFYWFWLFTRSNADAEVKVMQDLEKHGSPYVCATRDDVRHAAMTGILPLAFGLVGVSVEDSPDECAELGDSLVAWLNDDGYLVRWSGDPNEKVQVAVDRGTFALITEALDERDALALPPPENAEVIASTDGYGARVWFNGAEWQFDLYDAASKESIERGGGPTRNTVEEYVRERMEFWSDVN